MGAGKDRKITRPGKPQSPHVLTFAMVAAIRDHEIARSVKKMDTYVLDLCTQILTHDAQDFTPERQNRMWLALQNQMSLHNRRQAITRRHWQFVLLAMLLLVLLAAVCIAAGIVPWLQHMLWNDDQYHADIGIVAAVEDTFSPTIYGDALGEAFINALIAQGMAVKLPMRLPDGYALEDVSVTELQDTWHRVFAVFRSDQDALFFTVNHVTSENGAINVDAEKDTAYVEVYTTNGREVSIFENLGRLSALYVEHPYTVFITGDVSREDLKTIIDSIEEEQK